MAEVPVTPNEDAHESDPAPPAPEEPQDSIESEDVKVLKDAIQSLKKECQEAEASLDAIGLDLTTEVKILDIIKAKISASTAIAVKALQCFIVPPRATFMILKAVLHMIGQPCTLSAILVELASPLIETSVTRSNAP